MTSLWMNPERAHVWPVMSDSVNTSGGERKEKTKQNIVLRIYGVALPSFHLFPFVLLQFDDDLHVVLLPLVDLNKKIIHHISMHVFG